MRAPRARRSAEAKGALLAPDAVTFSKSLRVEPTLEIASDEGDEGMAIPLVLATSMAVNAVLLVLLLRSYLRKSESSGEPTLQDEDMLHFNFFSCWLFHVVSCIKCVQETVVFQYFFNISSRCFRNIQLCCAGYVAMA